MIKKFNEFKSNWILNFLAEERGVNQAAKNLAVEIAKDIQDNSNNTEFSKDYEFIPYQGTIVKITVFIGKASESWYDSELSKVIISLSSENKNDLVIAHELNHAIELWQTHGLNKSGDRAFELSNFWNFSKRIIGMDPDALKFIWLAYRSHTLELNAIVQETYQKLHKDKALTKDSLIASNAWKEATEMSNFLLSDNAWLDVKFLTETFNKYYDGFVFDKSEILKINNAGLELKKKLSKTIDLVFEEIIHAKTWTGNQFLGSDKTILEMKTELEIKHIPLL